MNQPIEPTLDYGTVIAQAEQEAERKGWEEPVGSAFYNARYEIYGVLFFQPGDDHGSGGFGVKQLYFDGSGGSSLGERIPSSGTAGDIFLQLQFPLHSGRIFISLMGLVVAGLSVTGIVIWFKRRGGLRLIVRSASPVMTTNRSRSWYYRLFRRLPSVQSLRCLTEEIILQFPRLRGCRLGIVAIPSAGALLYDAATAWAFLP